MRNVLTSSSAPSDTTRNVFESAATKASVPPRSPSSAAGAAGATESPCALASGTPDGCDSSADIALHPPPPLLLEPHELQPLLVPGHSSHAQLHWQLPKPVGQQRVQLGSVTATKHATRIQ